MSQVIVEIDNLSNSRAASKVQELKISKNSGFKKWENHGDFGLSFIQKAVAFAALPFIAFWTVMLGVLLIAIGVTGQLFRLLGILKK